MNKTVIYVPKGVKFISDWEGFKLPEVPTIINKQICGCGFTEWCMRSPYNIILCSPRKILLENKEEQHNTPDENGEINYPIFYARNELDITVNVDKDISGVSKAARNDDRKEKELITNIKEKLEKMYDDIRNYAMSCMIENRPIKIIVTSDSFRHVRAALGNMFSSFYVVVDEFQSIFMDSRFKSDTELEFLASLKGFDRLCFVSATPMVDEYLEMLDEFKDLPFIEYDWKTLEPERVERPNLNVFPCKNIIKVAEREIQNYLHGNFKKKLYKFDSGQIQEVESKELVIYVNSVRNICDIIKKCQLTYENTNVLCARSSDNRLRIAQAFGLKKPKRETFSTDDEFRDAMLIYMSGGIGSVPKKGKPHKMFTLCTRTVYLGADFYSTCARSLVLSDSNSDCLSVDISLDLPQIIGRQRLKENPWVNMADFYYVTSIKTEEELENLKRDINLRCEKTESLLKTYEKAEDGLEKATLLEMFESIAESDNYKKNYVAVNCHTGSNKAPEFNKLVMLADIRAYEIQKTDYRDRFCVMASVNKENNISNNGEYSEFINKFNSLTQFTEKMKLLCENPEMIDEVPYEFSNYLYALGPEAVKACQYKRSILEDRLRRVLGMQDDSAGISDKVYAAFKIGEKYSKSEIKSIFQTIYEDAGIKSTAKAVLIKEYFRVRDTMTTNKETGKRDSGFEIIGLNENIS